MKKKDVLKLLFCSVMVFNLTANAVVKAEEQPVDSVVTQPVENNETGEQPFEAEPREERDDENEGSEENNSLKTILFVGEWTGENSRKVDVEKTFEDENSVLGSPTHDNGLLRGVGKIFLGWSDKEPVGNGKIADGAKLYSKGDKVSTAFPNGVPTDAKLYAVYFSLNDPDSPIPADAFSIITEIVGNLDKLDLSSNLVTISGDDIVSKKIEEKNPDENTIIKVHEFEEKDDINKINEVKLESEFKMDDNIAMLVYNTPRGGYSKADGSNEILSRNYREKFANGDFETEETTDKYTYVDLVVNIDDRLTLPETLYLEFEGYSWRPLYVFGAETDGSERDLLEILNPETEANLGNDKNTFTSLVKNDNPKVKFAVKTNGKNKITVRMILRNGEERIDESRVVPTDGKTIAETVLENMKLRALSSDEIEKLTNKTPEEINKLVIKVSNENAKKLAEDNDENPIKVTGEVKGNVVASMGSLPIIGENPVSKPIEAHSSNTVALEYVKAEEKVVEEVPSDYPTVDLPIYELPTTPTTPVTPNKPEVTDKENENKDKEKPKTEEKVKIEKKKNLPKTNVSSTSSLVALAGFLGMVFTRKRKNK